MRRKGCRGPEVAYWWKGVKVKREGSNDCDVRLYERHGSKTCRKLVLDSVPSLVGEMIRSRVYCRVGRGDSAQTRGLERTWGNLKPFHKGRKHLSWCLIGGNKACKVSKPEVEASLSVPSGTNTIPNLHPRDMSISGFKCLIWSTIIIWSWYSLITSRIAYLRASLLSWVNN